MQVPNRLTCFRSGSGDARELGRRGTVAGARLPAPGIRVESALLMQAILMQLS